MHDTGRWNGTDSPLDPIATLAEPVRRRLYEFVVAQGVPTDRDTAAEGAGVGRPLAAFHLDRLVDAGLLEAVYRRRSGRTGPGAGRPAKFYVRAPERELQVSLPPRHYDLAAEILADAIDGEGDARARVLETARERGVSMATGSPDGERRSLIDLLAAQGYEPFVDVDGVVRLRNCPFHALVGQHRELTCSMNLAVLEGVTAALGEGGLEPRADPRPGCCCVAFVPSR